jgi:hypothetical protein
LLLSEKVLSAAAMLLKVVQYAAWTLSSVLLLGAAAQLWRGSHLARLPIFFVYLVLVGFHGLLNLLLSFTNPLWWFYSFYVGNVITTLLGFVVLYEVADSAVSGPSLKIDRSTFMALCAVGAFVAVAVTAFIQVEGHSFLRVRILLEVALRVVQVTILAIFAILSFVFGLFWRRVEFGVVLGYGLYATSQLAVMYLRASGSAVSEKVFAVVPMLSFCASALVWLVYSSMAEPAFRTDSEPLLVKVQRSHAAIERLGR